MVRYLSLLRFTDEGWRSLQHSSKRAAEFRAAVEAGGGSIVSQDWAVGKYDGCVLFTAPNEEAAASLLLHLGSVGHVRAHSMRLFGPHEFERMIGKT